LFDAACAAALGDFEPPPVLVEELEGDFEPEADEDELEGDFELDEAELGPCPAPEGPLLCPPWPVLAPPPVEVLVVVVPVVVPEPGRETPLEEALSSA
jgi:hypothetical protein